MISVKDYGFKVVGRAPQAEDLDKYHAEDPSSSKKLRNLANSISFKTRSVFSYTDDGRSYFELRSIFDDINIKLSVLVNLPYITRNRFAQVVEDIKKTVTDLKKCEFNSFRLLNAKIQYSLDVSSPEKTKYMVAFKSRHCIIDLSIDDASTFYWVSSKDLRVIIRNGCTSVNQAFSEMKSKILKIDKSIVSSYAKKAIEDFE